MEVSNEHANAREEVRSPQNSIVWCLSPDPSLSSDSELSSCFGNLHCREGSTPRRRLQLTPELQTPSPTQNTVVSQEMTTPTDKILPEVALSKRKGDGSVSWRCSVPKMRQHSGKVKGETEDGNREENKENRRLRVKLSSRFGVSMAPQNPAREERGQCRSPRVEAAGGLGEQPLLPRLWAQSTHRPHPLDIADSEERNLIGDYSKPHLFPLERGEHQDLRCISAQTVASLLIGNYRSAVESYIIIDCRYPYEYQGGHIKGAVNVHSEVQLREALFQDAVMPQMSPMATPLRRPPVGGSLSDACSPTQGGGSLEACSSDRSGGSSPRKVIVFHCEFSTERAPRLCRYLRELDRNLNDYPLLFYPELYVLEGGYKEFHSHFPGLCDPNGYVPMRHRDFREQLCRFRRKRRSRAMRLRKKRLFKPDSL